MAETYIDILNIGIGRVKALARANDYFPIVGETVTIDADLKWAQSTEWNTRDGSGGAVTEPGHPVLQKDRKSFSVIAAGELVQQLTARNSISETTVQKTIYSMQKQELPYFDIDYSNTSEVIRAGSDNGRINLVTENGYSKSLQDSEQTSVQIRIYKENETANPVVSKSYENDLFTIQRRGVYDVEVDVTDLESGITLRKRINKLITVTPALCPKPSDTGKDYEVVDTYNSFTSYSEDNEIPFELRLWRNVDGSGLNYAEAVIPRGDSANGKYPNIKVWRLPSGTTLCLKADGREPEGYPRRLFMEGDSVTGSESGTPGFTHDSPLVITHDCEEVLEWTWRSYGAIQTGNNMRNVVYDGYGYHNTGIHLMPLSGSFSDSCLFVNNGASDFEIFGLDIDGAGFAGVSAKTDPSPDAPWFWRENGWEMNLSIHHCTFRNTVGEGIYLGYFDTTAKTGVNKSGQQVTYHAHIIHPKVYRSEFLNNGYDSVQINNATEVEFCYCILDGCGYRREPNQGSAFSVSLDGKIYNNIVKNNYNIIGVINPFLSKIELFNNVLTAARMEKGLYVGLGEGLSYFVYNNVIKAASIAQTGGEGTVREYMMSDNILISENGDTSLPAGFSGSGNVFLKADLDYPEIDTALKVADSANYNYQPAYNSPSVTSGKAGRSPFDMRGYRNWYIGNFHAGPFMGKYKDVSVVDEELSLTRVNVDEGALYTYNRDVTIRLVYGGLPTKYRIGEGEDLSSSGWADFSPSAPITYTLSEGFGNKTVYVQLGNANEVSAVVSSGIEYRKEPLGVTLTLNGGRKITTSAEIPVLLNISGVYETLRYMLSENADFSGASYADYAPESEMTFVLSSGKGIKSVYVKVRSDDGQEAVAQADVEYTANKCILSVFNWGAAGGFDEESGINRIKHLVGFQLYDVMGRAYCKIGKLFTNTNQPANRYGNTTGNDGGVYPDIYLERNTQSWTNASAYSQANDLVLNGLVPGNYRVKLLANSKAGFEPTLTSYYSVNGNVSAAVDKGLETFKDNFNHLMTWDNVAVGDNGEFRVGFYRGDSPTGVAILNVIEIEEV